MNYPGSVHLTQEMVGRWCRQHDSETNNSYRSRIYAVYSLVKYLSEGGSSEVLSPRTPRKERVTYILYAFSGDEICSFFKACDDLPDIPKIRNVLIRRITALVFFRLLYSNDIYTTEARLLECADVDVGNRVLNIRYSKGHDQHHTALRDSMANLIRRYGSAIREWFPSRKYFSLASGDTAYPHTRVEESFRRAWVKVSNDQAATTHAFRHHYATANISRWTGDGFVFDDKFIHLSKSMGHTTLEGTRYYCFIIPGLFDIVLKRTEDGFNELIPEMTNR